MNAFEANVLLTKAALLDPRMKRVDPVEQADMATAWAEVLDDIPLLAALAAVREHYRREPRTITPADVRILAESIVDETAPTTTEIRERAQRDAWLIENGIDPAEWDRRVAAGQKPIRILAELGVDVKEITA